MKNISGEFLNLHTLYAKNPEQSNNDDDVVERAVWIFEQKVLQRIFTNPFISGMERNF